MLYNTASSHKRRGGPAYSAPPYLIPLGILFCGVLNPLPLAGQQASSIYSEAEALVRSGNVEKGCTEVEEVIRLDHDSYEAYNLLGLCATSKSDLQLATSLFRKSLILNPRFVEARVNLAVNLYQRSERQEAVEEFQKVLKMDPNELTALYNLGKIELAGGSVRDAIQHLHRASKLSPHSVEIGLLLASALVASGETQTAASLLRPMIKQERDSHVLLSAGMVALQAGEGDLGREALERAVQFDPKIQADIINVGREECLQAKYSACATLLGAIEQSSTNLAEWNALLGYAEYKLGQPTSASEHLRHAIALAPDVEDYYMKMGELMLYYNSDQVAVEVFNAGLKQHPRSALLRFGLAASYWAHENNNQAAEDQLKEVLKVQPDFQPALSLLCRVTYRQRQWEQLSGTADKLIKLEPNSYEGYYYKALALAEGHFVQQTEGGNEEEPGRLLEHAIRLNPNSADPRVALGQLLMDRGQKLEAIAEFKYAIRFSPNDPRGYYQLALAYRKAGEQRKSAEAFKRFETLKARQPDGWQGLFRLGR